MTGVLQPVTLYVPPTAAEPVEVKVAHTGLRMVLVTRDSARLLDDSWKVLGVYFLLGPADDDPDRYRAYVGEVGRRDLLIRLNEHLAQKRWWSRALLIASDSPDGFNSAEIGWLEGRLYDVLNNAVAAEVMNKGRPGDDSIPLKDRGVLERYVEPIMAALRACGAPPDTADQKPPPKGKKRAYYHESVKDLIDANLLKAGTRLSPMRKQLTDTALVLEDGSLQVDGVEYQAVSPAAVAVSGNKSEPGWEFWGAPSGDGSFAPLYELRDRLRTEKHHTSGPTQGSNVPADLPPLPLTAHSKVRRYPETMRDLIEAGMLSVGEVLHTTRRGRSDQAEVLEDGSLRFGEQRYSSPSGAARAASGTTAEPGWEYWAVERGGAYVRLFELRDELRKSQAPTNAPAAASGGVVE